VPTPPREMMDALKAAVRANKFDLVLNSRVYGMSPDESGRHERITTTTLLRAILDTRGVLHARSAKVDTTPLQMHEMTAWVLQSVRLRRYDCTSATTLHDEQPILLAVLDAIKEGRDAKRRADPCATVILMTREIPAKAARKSIPLSWDAFLVDLFEALIAQLQCTARLLATLQKGRTLLERCASMPGENVDTYARLALALRA
jgi:hypothetical protein